MASKNLKIYLLILLLVSIGTLLFVQVVMDDAYIPFRYGYNWVTHGIWNYYPEKTRLVEGYTTFSYAILSVIPAYLHIHPYIFFKLLGAVFFFLILYRLYTSTDNKYIAALAILVFTANWQTYVHTYSGLETIFWYWLFLQVIFILNTPVTHKKQIYLWLLCLLLPLTRPEGILIGLFAFIYLRFIVKSQINYLALAIFIAIGILYFVARYHYFGELLPLPFYQKSVKSNAGMFNLIVNTFSSIHYIVCLLLFLSILRANRYFKLLAIFVLLVFFMVYGTTLLTMNFADRFSFQLFFPVILFGIISSASMPDIAKTRLKYAGIFLTIFCFAKAFYSQHAKDFSSFGDNLFSGYYYSRTHLNLAMHFRKLQHPDIKVFCNEAGVFPYYSNIEYHDPEGLTDAYLSKRLIDSNYIKKIQPDAFLYLAAIPKQEVDTWANHLPKGHPLAYYQYILNSTQYEKLDYVVCIDYNVYIGIAVNKSSSYYHEICSAGKDAIRQSEEDKFNLRRFFKFYYSKAYPTLP